MQYHRAMQGLKMKILGMTRFIKIQNSKFKIGLTHRNDLELL